ncbi:hypothetical protein GP2_001_00200 [Gordonia paraffinivorans NBRC 108238]|uniref:Low molecular weight antigen MTB12-like C-terminal domain-containing protein n=4 Tax=Gordonia paraffinivorans TaxID=175628 RepID=A0ABQ0IF12_9ACTN|nr:hypothetical protein GP2_001_00200 [Gordonia paraffinivorans NBRC 108238]VFA82791.1 Uncharacterised protein [Gordonia paraffinivorans]
MKYRKFLGATMIAAAMMTGVAACGGSDDDAPPAPTLTSTAAANASGAAGDNESEITNGSKPPSIAALNELVDTAVDPKIPAKDKTDLVQGSEKDPEIFDELVKAREDNPDVKWSLVNPVITNGPKKANVKVRIETAGNPPANAEATIVFDKGRWKLSNQTVCNLLGLYQVESAMCTPAGGATSSKKADN